MKQNTNNIPAFKFIELEHRQQGFDEAVQRILDHLERCRAIGPTDRSRMPARDVGYYDGIAACIEQIRLNFREEMEEIQGNDTPISGDASLVLDKLKLILCLRIGHVTHEFPLKLLVSNYISNVLLHDDIRLDFENVLIKNLIENTGLNDVIASTLIKGVFEQYVVEQIELNFKKK